MKITYQDFGRTLELEYDPDTEKWTGEDFQLVSMLNANPHSVVGRHEYYRHIWYLVKATADALEGTLDEPEPNLGPAVEGRIY